MSILHSVMGRARSTGFFLLLILVLPMLLAVAAVETEEDVGGTACAENDATALRDTLRRSACRLGNGRGNATARAAFRESVFARFGEPKDSSVFHVLAVLFRLNYYYVWCRSSCPLEGANITWCVDIAYPDRVVQSCVHLDANSELVVNSTCEADLVGVPKALSLPGPEECRYTGGQGCLALSNLDWFYEAAILTCSVENTVDGQYCKENSFTNLITQSGVANPPEFEVVPESPLNVLHTNRLVIPIEISSTTDRVTMTWTHGDTRYNEFIFEDPFCEEECNKDNHPKTKILRENRVKAFRDTRYVQLHGCQTNHIFRHVSYLIVENVTADDAGEYVFNISISYHGFDPISATRSVNVSVNCELIPEKANCSVVSPHNVRGNSSNWDCVLNDHPYSNLSLVLNKTTTIFPSKPGTRCRDNSSDVIFYYEEKRQHTCFSSFKAFVLLCSANSSMNGEYAIMGSGGDMTPGSQIEVKVLHSPNVVPIHSAKKEELHPAVYVVPVTFLITLSVAIAIVFLIILRNRKRTRDRRIITRVHSPSLKEVSFLKDDAEPRLHSPTSPGNCSLGDPLEFPRNRLYIYSNKILGEGSFGRVMQAKAQGIVPGMPDRNIVAVKTTKDNATGIEREELLAELQLMKYMEPHENILNLLGHCTTPGAPVCLIVEYASYGNLRDFLRQCEDVVLSLNHMPHMPRNRSRTRTMSTSSCGSTQPLLARNDSVFTPGSGNSHFVFPSPPPPGQGHMTSGSQSSDGGIKMTAHHPDATAVPLAHSVAPIGHDYLNTKGLVYMEDVHNFALQIACGLQHLAHMEIVHCDLAARNVLIAENFVLKIADFGLARDISGRELYKKNPRGKIPVKWTAPEALEHRVFTVKSDVWSYGILLWELFTYGHTPYPDVNLGTSYESFISFLKDGQRMGQPENCTAFFYDLMLQCWNFDPSLRPTPNDIVAQLTPSDSIFGDEEEEEGVDSGSAGTSTQPTSPKTTTSSGPAAGHQSSQE